MKRILVLAGAAAAGVAAYLLLRSPPSGGARQNDPENPGVTRPIHRAPPAGGPDGGGRRIGRVTPGTAGASETTSGEPERPPSVTFEQEVREVGWASEQEKEMTLRLRKVVDELAARGTPIDIDAIECRASQCRVTIHARDEAALGRMYAQLETTDGLYGWADNLILLPVETAPDGQVTTHVIASFERELERR